MSSRKSPRRVVSVDVFRGATIVAMILVNNPGDWGHVYAPLLHAEWHGWTPTDLIFPFFLFIVGVAIALALGRRLEKGAEKKELVRKIVRRSLLLFALGLFLSGYPFGLFGPRSFEQLLATWRIPGVLQRIAICYLIVSLLFVYCRRRTLRIWTVVLLFGYWALITLVPVPGIGAPDLASKSDQLPGFVDRVVFGQHVWSQARVYDPEGLLSTIPALATTLFGLFAGLVLASRRQPLEILSQLFLRGSALVVAGSVLAWFLPLNKALWTSSYAVFTAGQAFCALALCYWLFDMQDRPTLARPFTIYGINAITLYVGSGLLAKTLIYVEVGKTSLHGWIYPTLFSSWLPPHPASLAYALAWILGWFLVLAWMARRGIVIKV